MLLRLLLIASLVLGCSSHLADPPLRVRGEKVVLEHDAELPGLARASREPRGPVVYLADGFDEFPPAVQWWGLAHELCHHWGVVDELDADCCALGWCVRSFGYDDGELVEILTTLSGGARAAALLECAQEVMP